MTEASAAEGDSGRVARAMALRFVLLIGVVSLFADFTYEGSRSIVGPYLALLGAGATVVSLVSGFGELLGYGLRLVSGRLSDRTKRFWPITLLGYAIQMPVVPLLALAGSWQVAAVLVMLERVGKATRNPPRDVMLSHAGAQIGRGWAFGLHEALDQSGALLGPLAVAAVIALRGQYRVAFAVLAIPAVITLVMLTVARFTYPQPERMESNLPDLHTHGLPRVFWLYLAATAFVAAGFADFPLIAFHFAKSSVVSSTFIPIFYAVAMATGGAGSLLFGRLFDRAGLVILIPLTILSTLFAPFVFFGGFALALIGTALWGLGMGVHETLIPAAVAGMVPAGSRASAYGLFTAGYGTAWFLGSAVLGILYPFSLSALVAFSVVTGLAAISLFVAVAQQLVVRP